ncbi:hypothetical protein RISK_005158 [Rhodopirellula islandica]|uniref:Uncharacterized protein n=1 Tax=Rhodopirellula islandica TaxID=595434 RepID=A0A0J1B806_RHOIS|nr:hypothetical protein RISK_005158 [Rhodopirellula islandica]
MRRVGESNRGAVAIVSLGFQPEVLIGKPETDKPRSGDSCSERVSSCRRSATW